MFQTLYMFRYVHDFHLWEIIFSLGISVGLLFLLQKMMLLYVTNTIPIEHRNGGDLPRAADEQENPEIVIDLMDDLITEPVLGDGN